MENGPLSRRESGFAPHRCVIATAPLDRVRPRSVIRPDRCPDVQTSDRPQQAAIEFARMNVASSALCEAFHKADYAKSLIMESSWSEPESGTAGQQQARIPAFA